MSSLWVGPAGAVLALAAAALLVWPPRRPRSAAADRLGALGAGPIGALGAGPIGAAATPAPSVAAERSQPGRGLLAAGVGSLLVVALAGLTPAGVAMGAVVSVLSLLAARRRAAVAATRRDAAEAAELPLFLEVVATQLRAGAPVAAALQRAAALAPASARAPLREASAMLRLGAPVADAWRCAQDSVLGDFAALARRSADNGAQLADQCVRLAAEVRAERVAGAEAAARAAGVWAMAPLGLCFLPAFICLGVAPVVLGLVGAALGGGSMPAGP